MSSMRLLSTSLTMAAATTPASAYDVAIIGGGIAGCAAARSLAVHDPAAKITVYEIGRGPGGRASTRRTRGIPALRINHGAPFADISTPGGRELVRDLGLATFGGRYGRLDSATGAFGPSDEEDGRLFVTGSNNEMANVASSLLTSGSADAISTRYSSMVRGLSRDSDDRWHLRDKSGAAIGSADWLIVAGSGVAHPRWTATFGGDPPLVAAATDLDDPVLDEALTAVALQEASPVLAVFFYCTGGAARNWLDLGFHVGELGEDGVLSKIIVQPNGEGCSVVIHSTTAFAEANTGVYGSSSSAARVGDASSDSSREEIIIKELLNALSDIPGMPEATDCGYGPLLHRWGNAFPKGEPLPERLALCQSSRVGFCGDYTETPARMGSVESALLSGTSIGERIAQLVKGK